MLRPLSIEKHIDDLIDIADNMEYPITGLARLIRGKMPKIIWKKGHSIKEVDPGRHNVIVFGKILFKLLEYMFLDVVDGHIVYFDRVRKSRFFIAFLPVFQKRMEHYKEEDTKYNVDFSVTNYTLPIFAFDPGYELANPAKVYVPEYLYEILIENVNEGKKYSRPYGKKFIRELNDKELKERLKRWEIVRSRLNMRKTT